MTERYRGHATAVCFMQQTAQVDIRREVDHGAVASWNEDGRIRIRIGNIGKFLRIFHHGFDTVVKILDVVVLVRIRPHFQYHRPTTRSGDIKCKARISEM